MRNEQNMHRRISVCSQATSLIAGLTDNRLLLRGTPPRSRHATNVLVRTRLLCYPRVPLSRKIGPPPMWKRVSSVEDYDSCVELLLLICLAYSSVEESTHQIQESVVCLYCHTIHYKVFMHRRLTKAQTGCTIVLRQHNSEKEDVVS